MDATKETKFSLLVGVVNKFLIAFSKNNRDLTKECQRLKKDNMQTQWPVWKATLEGVEIT